jgi:hypothetical protein
MRRALALILVVLAALAAAGPTAAASGPTRAVFFQLHVDGFLVRVKSIQGGRRIELLFDRHGEVAYYGAREQIGAGTVTARFGNLGALDFKFSPAHGEGPLGCVHGEGWQRGTFEGSFRFHGENHYADIAVGGAPGWFQTRPAENCAGSPGRGKAPAATATASRAGQVAETGALLEGVTGSREPLRYFEFSTENRKQGIRVSFNAVRAEHREGMEIERGAEIYGGAATFHWNLLAGTARVEPPAPFSGRAFYRRGPSGPPSWTGSLRVPVLGGRPIRLTGADFNAHLGHGT